MLKQIEKFLYHTCAYAVVTSVLFFLFAMATGMNELAVSFNRYLIIIGFSAIITAAEYIFLLKKLPKFICYLIHFLALFSAFLVVFILINGNLQFRPSFIFSALIIFTLIYFVILGAILIIKHIVAKKIKSTSPHIEKTDYTAKFDGTKR